MSLKSGITKRTIMMICGSMLVLCLTACSAEDDKQQPEEFQAASAPEEEGQPPLASFLEESPAVHGAANEINSGENETMKMNVQVGERTFTAALEENEAAAALVKIMEDAPVVIQMSDYSGFEKLGSLGTNLPADNSHTTTHSGDIVLYNGNQIVIFYGSNSWSYTRLGKIDDLTGWEEALGSGDVTVTFSVN